MTTKTDAARECAEEIESIIQQLNELKKDYHTQYYYEKEIESVKFRLNKLSGQHFPPSVPVNKLEQLAEWWLLEAGAMDKKYKNPAPFDIAKRECANKLKALIAEAEHDTP